MAKIGEYACHCGGRIEVNEAANGTLSTACRGACGQRGFIKSPNGVAAMRAKLDAPAAKNEHAFDITKL